MKLAIKTIIVMFALTTAATASDGPSIEKGKELFNSNQLGTNGKSCATCHPEGKGLKDVAANDNKTLAKISNQCIAKALKGKALADGSPELNSLIMYMKASSSAKPK